VGGQARLALRFDGIERDGRMVAVAAEWALVGKSETGKDAATIAAGAAAGAVLGHQVKKGSRGKILGGLIGAGIGTAVASATEGEKIELAPDALLEAELLEAVTLEIPES
jgi:uncharacterized membrane protein YeaQ/YmgE (transglycosylase-associated protein family)